ncbi:hypothetical protein AVEN_268473-1 [Araneus ventricosus]|uniref:Paired domain-containing protein n=1 Tax=Araneus ventricosus TaxID=182803 RepID=A0A4Y2JSQ2_ARAVE|nr:hypothetical protein AVEN_268473-1 [Araneus ventricosus]
MARGRATDLAVRNEIIQQHQNVISQHQIGRTFLTQSTVCSIIKRFATTGKNRPGKAPSLKLTLIDREVSLFRRHNHIFVKIGTWQMQTLSHGQDKILERLFPKHLRLDISKGVATNSTKRDVSHFSLHRINAGVLRGPNLTSNGLHLSGKRYCGQMNPYLRFYVGKLNERLLGRRMKQTIHPVTSALFLKQAL